MTRLMKRSGGRMVQNGAKVCHQRRQKSPLDGSDENGLLRFVGRGCPGGIERGEEANEVQRCRTVAERRGTEVTAEEDFVGGLLLACFLEVFLEVSPANIGAAAHSNAERGFEGVDQKGRTNKIRRNARPPPPMHLPLVLGADRFSPVRERGGVLSLPKPR